MHLFMSKIMHCDLIIAWQSDSLHKLATASKVGIKIKQCRCEIVYRNSVVESSDKRCMDMIEVVQ